MLVWLWNSLVVGSDLVKTESHIHTCNPYMPSALLAAARSDHTNGSHPKADDDDDVPI